MANTFSEKKVLILGAGVTGVAVAHALAKRGAKVSLADDVVTEVNGFSVSTTDQFSVSEFDALVVSP